MTYLVSLCIGFTTESYAMESAWKKGAPYYWERPLSDLYIWNVTVRIPEKELSITIRPSDNKRIMEFKDESLPAFKSEEIALAVPAKSKLIEVQNMLLPILSEVTRKKNGKLHADQAVVCFLQCIIKSTGVSHTFELKDEHSTAMLIRANDVTQKVEKKMCEIEGIKRPDDNSK
jgi:hypothetical protein